MGYIKTLPLPPPRCRSVPHQLPPASAVCSNIHTKQKSIKKIGVLMKKNFIIYTKG